MKGTSHTRSSFALARVVLIKISKKKKRKKKKKKKTYQRTRDAFASRVLHSAAALAVVAAVAGAAAVSAIAVAAGAAAASAVAAARPICQPTSLEPHPLSDSSPTVERLKPHDPPLLRTVGEWCPAVLVVLVRVEYKR